MKLSLYELSQSMVFCGHLCRHQAILWRSIQNPSQSSYVYKQQMSLQYSMALWPLHSSAQFARDRTGFADVCCKHLENQWTKEQAFEGLKGTFSKRLQLVQLVYHLPPNQYFCIQIPKLSIISTAKFCQASLVLNSSSASNRTLTMESPDEPVTLRHESLDRWWACKNSHQ